MNKNKRIFFAVSIVLVLIFSMLMAGCSADDSDSTAEPTKAVETDAVEQDEDIQQEQVPTEGAMEVSGTISVWTWEPFENQELVINDFYKSYPNTEVVFTTVASEDMPMKIQTALAAGSELPDVVWSEIEQRGKMLSFDCWEDLSQAPYNVMPEDLLSFTVPLSTTSTGKLVGLEVSPPVAGMAYKRDLALEYFGTDDPSELSAMFTTWEDFIEAGKEILAKSNGEVLMFSTMEEAYKLIAGQYPEPFIADGSLNLDAAFSETFRLLIDFKKAGIVDILDAWTPAWNASFAEKTNIFNYCPSWGPTWVFKAKAPDETKGNWGVMVPPGGGCLVGGTNVLIPEKAENKLGGFAYIKWNYLSVEGAASNRDNLDYFSVYAPVYDDATFYSAPDEFFGGQDVLQFFAQTLMPNMAPTRPVNKYDIEVNEAAALAIKTISDSDGTDISVQQLLDDMQAEILNNAPELN